MSSPASKFLDLFVNNPNAYALQNSDGGYFAKRNAVITDVVLEDHLVGDLTLGVYAINPENNTTKWICWDFDKEEEEALGKIHDWLADRGFTSFRESIRPGRSGHLWLFFDRAIQSEYAYRLGFHLRFIAGTGCEIYPKVSALKAGQLGNLVRLPLGIHRKSSAGGVRGLFQRCPSQEVVDQLLWIVQQRLVDVDRAIDLIQSLPAIQIKSKKTRKKTGSEKPLLNEFPDDWPWQERPDNELVGLCPKCYVDSHDAQQNNLSLNTERNVLRCHYNQGEHTFKEIMEALKIIKNS